MRRQRNTVERHKSWDTVTHLTLKPWIQTCRTLGNASNAAGSCCVASSLYHHSVTMVLVLVKDSYSSSAWRLLTLSMLFIFESRLAFTKCACRL
eukprot:4433737-Amphidinium_carterae.1